METPDYDEIEPYSDEVDSDTRKEIKQVVAAAHALKLDAPITAYRIVGSRIELWTCHGGPFVFDPKASPPSKPASKQTKKSKPTARTAKSDAAARKKPALK